jgi:hypothetical protein
LATLPGGLYFIAFSVIDSAIADFVLLVDESNRGWLKVPCHVVGEHLTVTTLLPVTCLCQFLAVAVGVRVSFAR